MITITLKKALIFLVKRYNVFLFCYKFFLKSFKKKNNKIFLILIFILIILIEIIFETLTLFKFSKVDKENSNQEEQNFTEPRSTICLQLINMIVKIKTDASIKFYSKKEAFMDIGCGYGKVIFFYKIFFKKLYGVEINKTVFEKLKKNFSNDLKKISLINKNYFSILIPKEVGFFYVFSPFHLDVLYNDLIDSLINHSKNNNKKIFVILGNKRCLEFFLQKKFKVISHQKLLQGELNTILLSYN